MSQILVEKQPLHNELVSSIKRKAHIGFSLFKLINAQFIKSGPEIFFVFGFGIIFIAFFGFITAAQTGYRSEAFMGTLSGILLLQVIQGGMQSMPSAIMEFKTSVLLKRIGATPIKPWMFILSTATYYFILTIIQIAWLILWIMLMFSFTEFNHFLPNGTDIKISGWDMIFGAYSQVEWGGYLFSLLYTTILSIFLGLFVASISKTSQTAQLIGMMFFFSNMFLAGLLFPISSINQIEALKVISYFTPYRYVSGLSATAWAASGNIFTPNIVAPLAGFPPAGASFGDSSIYLRFGVYDNYLNLLMPLLFIGLAVFASIKFFKWNVR